MSSMPTTIPRITATTFMIKIGCLRRDGVDQKKRMTRSGTRAADQTAPMMSMFNGALIASTKRARGPGMLEDIVPEWDQGWYFEVELIFIVPVRHADDDRRSRSPSGFGTFGKHDRRESADKVQ